MMRSSLVLAAAFSGALLAQSPLTTTQGGTVQVTTTPSPITGLWDMTVTDPQGIVLNQIDLQMNINHGTNGQLGVWMTAAGGTAVGNHQNAAVWTQVSSASTVHNGGVVSFTLVPPVSIAPGTYGIALHCLQANPVYHSGTISAALPQQYSTAELTLDVSASRFRISDNVNPFGGAAAGFTPRQPATSFHYVVGDRICDFIGTPLGGTSPLDVQFTALAASGQPGGILSYAWDFENDGVDDDFTPNPLHTFACGSYDVKLSIVDAAGQLTTTKMGYVVTDTLTPDFSYSLLSGSTIQFTDTTTPAAATWDWDLDGDGIFGDSSLQNPIWAYPANCAEVNVSVMVQRACQPAVSLTKKVVIGQPLETTFQSGLVTVGGQMNSANFLDANVTNPQGISICSMHVNSSVTAGNPVTVNIYRAQDTYVGKETDVTQWRLVSSAVGVSEGTGGQTLVQFSPPIHLPFGSHGLCMEHVENSPVYTNLGGTQVYSTGDVTLTLGAAMTTVFDPLSNIFAPRVANLAIYYTTTGLANTAGYGYIGYGCAGSAGVPTNNALTQPVINTTLTIEHGNLPFGIGIGALGVTRIPALDLLIIGMPGCPLYHTADATVTLVGVGTTATYSIALPNTPTLIGAQLHNSALSLDPAVNAFGFTISDATSFIVGG